MFDLVCPKNRFFHKNKHNSTQLDLCNMDIFLLNKKDIDSKTILHKNLSNMHIEVEGILKLLLLLVTSNKSYS